jgi:hypothetical protein
MRTVAICEQLPWMSFPHGGKIRMSGSISQKRRRKAVRQRSKEEVRWYIKFFADMIEEQHENAMFPNSEYTTLTSEQILRIIEGPRLRRQKQ